MKMDNTDYSFDLQKTILTLVARFDSMEEKIDLKLELIDKKITMLDEKLSRQIQENEAEIARVKAELENHCEDEDITAKAIQDHDKKIENAQIYIDRIIVLENRVNNLEQKVMILEQKPTVAKASLVDDLVVAIKRAVYIAVAGGVVGFILFLVSNYLGINK